MSSISKTHDLNAKDINNDKLDNPLNNHVQSTQLYELLQEREQCWWQARQQLIDHREKKIFWFGENSLIMWLLWQLVSYVVVAMLVMLVSNMLDIALPLWQYIGLFVLQTAIFVLAFAAKGRLSNRLQRNIEQDELRREQALGEMIVLAEDSLYPDVHAKSPISLRALYDYLGGEFHLASLECLLQKEVDAGRLILSKQQLEVEVLPPVLADDELHEHASEMIYKSTL